MNFIVLLIDRQQRLMLGMLPEQARAVACTALLAERPDDEAEIEAAYAEQVAAVNADLRERRERLATITEGM
jgi:hypothetical protein